MSHKLPFILKNSITGKREPILTRTKNIINWYVCGPTVYDNCHLGHARTYMNIDIMKKIMQRHRPGMTINLAMSVTDIDRKIIDRSLAESVDPRSIASRYEIDFIEMLDLLEIDLPDHLCRVSEHLDHIFSFIDQLLQKKIAYKANDGSIYFSVDQYKRRGNEYPIFAGQVMQRPESKISTLLSKRNLADFALWKFSGEKFSYKSPFGNGLPGWHIECSSIIKKVFGDHIDLHSGGIDLKFPHHENELAQSRALCESGWCLHWHHTGHLLSGSVKMSKSLGNIKRPKTLIEEGVMNANIFRVMCLLTDWEASMSFSIDLVKQAKVVEERLRTFMNTSLHTPLTALDFCNESGETTNALFHQLSMAELNFDYPRIIKQILLLIKSTQEKPWLAQRAIKQRLGPIITQLGFKYGNGEAMDLKKPRLIDDSVAFRSKIRAESLAFLKHKERRTEDELPKSLLAHCDSFRRTLASKHGHTINDSQ